MSWWVYAVISAFAAAATAVLAKLGVAGVPSNIATALRTSVVLVFAWAVVFSRGERLTWSQLPGRTVLFLLLSGVATGISWLAYFRALQMAPVSRVAPIDKLSLPLTFVLAFLVLGEHASRKAWVGAALMACGAMLTL